MDWKKEVLDRQDQMVNLTRSFLKIESVLDEKTATEFAPFGKGIDEALRFLLQLGETYNLKTKNIDGYAGLIEYGDSKESVGSYVILTLFLLMGKDGSHHRLLLKLWMEQSLLVGQWTIKHRQWLHFSH